MDNTSLKEKDIESDLESGENTSEEDVSKDLDSRNRQLKNGFNCSWTGLLNFDGSYKYESRIESRRSSANSDDAEDDNIELLIGRNLVREDVEQLSIAKNNFFKNINRKANWRNPPKPPRPPKGPSLDAADQKFVKEVAELAFRKQARIKRMKAVKKMKANKATPSSYTNVSAMAVTVLFLLIIFLQGIKSGSSASVGLMTSPDPAVAADEALISIQFPKTFTAQGYAPDSSLFNSPR